jgi:hypothetical protein
LIVLIVGIVVILGGLGIVLHPRPGTSASHAQRDVFDIDQ